MSNLTKRTNLRNKQERGAAQKASQLLLSTVKTLLESLHTGDKHVSETRKKT